jgi:hypothetical protein
MKTLFTLLFHIKRYIYIIFILLFNSLHYSAFTQSTESEPNNTFETAESISILSEKIGTVQTSIDDDDYFKTVFPNDGTLKIFVQGTNIGSQTSYLGMYGYDKRKGEGRLFGYYIQSSSTQPGNTVADTFTFRGRAADTFYFRIVSTGHYNYKFKYNIEDTSQNDLEPNDNFEQAIPVLQNERKQGHIGYIYTETTGIGTPSYTTDEYDFYKTSINHRGKLQIIISAKLQYAYPGYAGRNFNIEVYDKRQETGALTSERFRDSTVLDTISISCFDADVIYFRINSIGVYNYEISYNFLQPEVKSSFEETRTGNLFEFTNTSFNSSNYKWDFGDGTTSTLTNPPLKAFKFGEYAVKLIVGNNSGCNNSDTSIKTITVKGIEKYTPTTGGNGNLLFTVYGYGFTESSKLTLSQGNKKYSSNNPRVNSHGNSFTCTMDMHDAPLGLYDLAIITDDSSYTVLNGFNLVPNYDSLRVEIIGNTTVRSGDSNIYKIRVYNDGNTAIGSTAIYILAPSDAKVTLLNNLIIPQIYNGVKPDTLDEFTHVTAEAGFPISGNLGGYIINGIPQNGFKDISINLQLPLGDIPIYAWCEGPFDGSPPRFWSKECFKSSLQTAISLVEAATGLIDGVGTPFKDCAYDLIKFGYDQFQNELTGDLNQFSQFKSDISVLSDNISYVSTLISCASAVGTLFPMTRPLATAIFTSKKLYSLSNQTFDVLSKGRISIDAIRNQLNNCSEKKISKTNKYVQSRNSFDPNSISGPAGFNAQHYISYDKKTLTYYISFENLKTATLPAQIVLVADTLDRNVFDYKTLKLQSFGIERGSYDIPNESNSFINDIIIDENLSVRLNIKLDTISGILKATFKTIDRVTGLITKDPLAGFLPPNIHNPEGCGYFVYSIDLKNNLTHGTVIKNKASITFDNNTPIETNTWSNKIDTVRPISKITNISKINDTTANIICNGIDLDSGVESYRLFVSENGSEYVWFGNISDTTNFVGKVGSIYSIYVLAVDSVGNIENKAVISEAIINFNSSRIYTFIGSGEWNNPNNWENKNMPPSVLPSYDQIIIKPISGGECILNVPQTISSNASLKIEPYSKFLINKNLTILK